MVFVNIIEMSRQCDTAKKKKSVILVSKCKTYPLSERGRSHDCSAEGVPMQVRFGNLKFENVSVI